MWFKDTDTLNLAIHTENMEIDGQSEGQSLAAIFSIVGANDGKFVVYSPIFANGAFEISGPNAKALLSSLILNTIATLNGKTTPTQLVVKEFTGYTPAHMHERTAVTPPETRSIRFAAPAHVNRSLSMNDMGVTTAKQEFLQAARQDTIFERTGKDMQSSVGVIDSIPADPAELLKRIHASNDAITRRQLRQAELKAAGKNVDKGYSVDKISSSFYSLICSSPFEFRRCCSLNSNGDEHIRTAREAPGCR